MTRLEVTFMFLNLIALAVNICIIHNTLNKIRTEIKELKETLNTITKLINKN